jgi:hypothetical protein
MLLRFLNSLKVVEYAEDSPFIIRLDKYPINLIHILHDFPFLNQLKIAHVLEVYLVMIKLIIATKLRTDLHHFRMSRSILLGHCKTPGFLTKHLWTLSLNLSRSTIVNICVEITI